MVFMYSIFCAILSRTSRSILDLKSNVNIMHFDFIKKLSFYTCKASVETCFTYTITKKVENLVFLMRFLNININIAF